MQEKSSRSNANATSQKSFQGYIFRRIRVPSFVVAEVQALHALIIAGVDHVV